MAGKKVVSLNAHGKFSTGNIATSITEALKNDSKFVYSRDNVSKDFAVKHYSKLELWSDIVMTRVTGFDSVWSWNNTRKILRLLKKEKPDIIHLHNLHGFYVNYNKLFKFIKKHNIKVVWTLHDCWSFTGHCAYFDLIGCEKWKTQCKNCPIHKETYLKSWLFDCSRMNFKRKKKAFCGVENLTVVTPSQWLADLARESFLKEYPIQVINNGVNVENFKIRPNENFGDILPSDKKIVVAVASSWDKRKGLDDVVEISRRLPRDYAVVVVGVTEEQKKQLKEENIITVTRTENQRQLAELYSAAYTFINPTYEENYPTVNLEALCCGCPVITYSTGGSAEMLDESNGIVVPKGDVEAMLSAVLGIGEKQFDREAISRAAREKHPYDGMIFKYIDLYNTFE